MRKREYDRVMSYLKDIKRNLKLTEHVLREKGAKPKYTDLMSLESFTRAQEIPCNNIQKYNCCVCLTKKRNKCWAIANKNDIKRILIAGLPYPRVILSNMQISSLWMIASYLKILFTRKTKSALVDAIIKKQYQLDKENK
jgi:hypothetical protein